MKIQKRKLNQGFTIIEVLIVLAIAGLILAIVFLAVPALQRNTRNNGRINDVARVGASVNNWVSNNNGLTPTTDAILGTVATDVGSTSQYGAPTMSTGASAASFAAACSASVTFCGHAGATGALPTADVGNIELVTNAVCAAGGSTTATGASAKSMAIEYVTEGGGGTGIPQCLNI